MIISITSWNTTKITTQNIFETIYVQETYLPISKVIYKYQILKERYQ